MSGVFEEYAREITEEITKKITKEVTRNNLLTNVKTLTETMHFTVEQAMDALNVPEEERDSVKAGVVRL